MAIEEEEEQGWVGFWRRTVGVVRGVPYRRRRKTSLNLKARMKCTVFTLQLSTLFRLIVIVTSP